MAQTTVAEATHFTLAAGQNVAVSSSAPSRQNSVDEVTSFSARFDSHVRYLAEDASGNPKLEYIQKPIFRRLLTYKKCVERSLNGRGTPGTWEYNDSPVAVFLFA